MSEFENDKQAKDYAIIVNGEPRNVRDEIVTYEEVVRLAFPDVAAGARYTVTYRGAKKPKEGSLKPGGKVEIHKRGAIFNVTQTVKS